MVEKGLVLPHGILEGAESGQAIGNEILQLFKGLLARDGPVEVFQAAGVFRKDSGDILHDLAGDPVLFEPRPSRQETGSGLAKMLAVIPVEIPAATCRLAVFHEEVETLPHVAVEMFHDECLAPFSPLAEFVDTAEKVTVRKFLQFDLVAFAESCNLLSDAMFTSLRHDQLCCVLLPDHGFERGRKAVTIRMIDLPVFDPEPFFLQPGGVMTHGGEEKCCACLV